MSKHATQRLRQPFPDLPAGLSPKMQHVLTHLESTLALGNHPRTLLKMGADLMPDSCLIVADRLLRFTKTKRILLLVSASGKPALVQAWKNGVSLEDGQLLSARYRTFYSPDASRVRRMQVCIAALREMQQGLQHSKRLSQTFDVVLIYDLPARLSPVWQQVMQSFAASSLIGFAQAPTPSMCAWFDDNIVEEEGMTGPTLDSPSHARPHP